MPIALSHMTMIGLAAILEDAGVGDVRVGWTHELDARPLIHTKALIWRPPPIVRDHARRHAAADSSVAASMTWARALGS